jgi:uncharacterized membrane protein YfcA
MTLLYIIIGLGGGVLAGVFGIGGGLVIVPALIYAARMSQLTATGTSLGALLLPVGALGAWEYYRTGNLNVRAALFIAVGLFVGAFFGAKIAHALTTIHLRRAFAVFLVLVAIRIWTTK